MRSDNTPRPQVEELATAAGGSVIDLRSSALELPTVMVVGFAGVLGAGLREIIRRDPGLRLIEPEGREEADVTTLVGEHRPGAALVNQEALENVIDARRLVLAHPDTRVVMCVMRRNRERDTRLLEAGVRVIVPITIDAQELCGVLRLVAQGVVGPPCPTRAMGDSGIGSLTSREIEVMRRLARQGSIRDIANELHVSEATVNTHRRRIYEKLGVHSRAQLAEQAARLLAGQRRQGDAVSVNPPATLSFHQRTDRMIGSGRPTRLHMLTALGARRWSEVRR